jgi:endoglucanase
MLRFILPLLFILLSHGAVAADCFYDPAAAPKTTGLKRGINLPEWWQTRRWSREQEELSTLHRMGFDFVRLPVHPKWLEEEDEEERKDILNELRCDVVSLLNAGLSVIVDLHPMGDSNREFMDMPKKGMLERLVTAWLRLGKTFDGLPHQRLLFNLYNEPSMPTEEWWPLQEKLVTRLRTSFPHHRFIVSGSPEDGFADMKPYSDPNVLYDFHFYAPMFFTHHGADWIDEYRSRRGPISYPAHPSKAAEDMDDETKDYYREGWNKKKLSGMIQHYREWKQRYGKQIICLEFGVYRGYTDAKSRANWLKDMRELLEEARIPWALWEYNRGFGLFSRGEADPDMAKALGLR